MKNVIFSIVVLAMFAVVVKGYILFEEGRLYDDDGVLVEHKFCGFDDQCVLVKTGCSGSCGSPINQIYVDAHDAKTLEVCENYTGPKIEVMCFRQELSCINKKCTSIEVR